MDNAQIKVAVVITNEKGEALLIKEKLPSKDRPLWSTVKGTYGDIPGENIFEAAVRECNEEAGVEVQLVASLGCYTVRSQTRLRIQFNFIANSISGTPTIASAAEQASRNEAISEIRWFTPTEITALPESEFVSTHIHALLYDWMSGKTLPLESLRNIALA